MNKLTDERESRPPNEIYLQVEVEWFSTEGVTWCVDKINDTDVAYVRKETLPCGHPGACVVSAPSAPGMVTTCHCGWCAAEAERDALREKLKAGTGLAEAASAVIATPLEDHGQYVPLPLVGLGVALAAWKEANDDVS